MINFPKLDVPTFTVTLYSTGQEVTLRPFTVKEEKILLQAKEGSEKDRERAVCQILENCTVSGEVENVAKLPFFDVEYLFLNLVARSISDKIELTFHHPDNKNASGDECTGLTTVTIPVSEVEVQEDESHKKDYDVGGGFKVRMRYPTLEEIARVDRNSADHDSELDIVARCLESVYSEEDAYKFTSPEEAKEFLSQDGMKSSTVQEIKKFFSTMPRVEYSTSYVCSKCSETEKVRLRGLQDFF